MPELITMTDPQESQPSSSTLPLPRHGESPTADVSRWLTRLGEVVAPSRETADGAAPVIVTAPPSLVRGRGRTLAQARDHLRRWWGLARLRLGSRCDALAKRGLDILVSGTLLLLGAPLLLLIAALVKFQDGGRVLFWQERVGRLGRRFCCPKFRSMVVNAERLRAQLEASNDHGSSVTFKMRRDPRITPIGRILRRLSLDELPQLWSILCGDMSLVGPRPPIPSEVERYSVRDRRRLEAVPGLTCIWQVSGRGELPFERQVELDIEYIERRGLGLDLWLLARTVPAVLGGRGAY